MLLTNLMHSHRGRCSCGVGYRCMLLTNLMHSHLICRNTPRMNAFKQLHEWSSPHDKAVQPAQYCFFYSSSVSLSETTLMPAILALYSIMVLKL